MLGWSIIRLFRRPGVSYDESARKKRYTQAFFFWVCHDNYKLLAALSHLITTSGGRTVLHQSVDCTKLLAFSCSIMRYLDDLDDNYITPLFPRPCASPLPTSPTIIPKIQQLTAKNANPAPNNPGTNVLRPKNSSWYACWSQIPCARMISGFE